MILSVGRVGSGSSRDLRLPLVTVGKELLLVVQELFSGLGGIFGVGSWFDQSASLHRHVTRRERTLNNGIHRAALLAVTAVDTLGHVDIISGGATAPVFTLLGLDGDGLGGADSFTQLAGNAALFAGGIAAQGVLSTEAGGDGAFFEGVVDGVAGTSALAAAPSRRTNQKPIN